MEIVTADIGGTNARFAIAEFDSGRVVRLSGSCVLKTSEHVSFEAAWATFAAQAGQPLPRLASIAVAGPASGETIRFTNNSWELRPRALKQTLALDQLMLINDFAAVAHAAAQLDEDCFRHVCGPQQPLPAKGVISVIGPGTGLGVSQIVRHASGYEVISTEGGHVSFAPVDATEDKILTRLRARFGRISVERVVSGPGLLSIHEALAAMEGVSPAFADDSSLWRAATTSADPRAVAALERFCLCYGAVVGDIALAQGARAVVLAGDLSARIVEHLRQPGFTGRFAAKGRFQMMMESLPVSLITHPQPGLFGAAAAFATDLDGGR
jgi:glucokinase